MLMAEDYHSEDLVVFAERLLVWWDEHGRRNLPWQKPRTPYRVWISEIMLQQTRVATAVPYFERFVRRFPDAGTLADSGLDEVLHYWSGLGYYARARNLHRAARIVADRGGGFPATAADLRELPGIGRSTAAAIVAQAYGVRASILDANVKRVLARQHRVSGPVSSSKTQNELWRLTEAHTPHERVADYTQAMMDLGAILCRRIRPQCSACPVRQTCQAFATDEVERFPEPAKRRTTRRCERRRIFVLTDPNGRCLVEQRPAFGIWGGLWSPPERDAEETLERFLAVAGIETDLVGESRTAAPFRHGFSHFDLDIEPVYARLRATPTVAHDRGERWIRPGEHALGLSAVAVKLLSAETETGTSDGSMTETPRRRSTNGRDR